MRTRSFPSEHSINIPVTHGANHALFRVVGKSVGNVRRCLTTVFNIPQEALALVGGYAVGADYLLQTGDRLEFLVRQGRKTHDEKGEPLPSDNYRFGDPCPYLLTEEEAIKYLRLDTIDIANPAATLRRYRDMGLLRATQVSKRLFFLRRELDLFLARVTDRNQR